MLSRPVPSRSRVPSPFLQVAALTLCTVGCLVPSIAAAGEGPAKARPDATFERTVQPLLARHCYKCHSHAAGKNKGGLVLDSLAGIFKGGDSGPAILAGKPKESPLIAAVRFESENLQMPPGKKLQEAEIAKLVAWVENMALPEGGASTTARGKITDADRAWWAFQPVKAVVPPSPHRSEWSRNEIDHFVLHRLEAEGLSPSPEADRRTMVRRLYFDVIGLPPSPVEVEAFLSDKSPDAYGRLVETLLASPHYGERWARHWLDLARYAESDGFRLDEYRPHAWRYRDYVVRSFNADKPYDRFVREQLAGDEIAPDDPDALAATAFLRHTVYEYNQRDVRTQWADMLNDLTDVTGEVFLGLGMGCARCHDHKFDPILQKDYYRLQAFFAAFLPREDTVLATPRERAEYAAKLAVWEKATAGVRRRIGEIEAPHRAKVARKTIEMFPAEIQAMIDSPAARRAPLEHQLAEMAYRQVTFEFGRMEKGMEDAEKHELTVLRKSLAEFDPLKPAPLPVGQTVTDTGTVAPPTALPKAADRKPIEPGPLTLFDEKPLAIPAPAAGRKTTGRRAALAEWITRPDNPLTARVAVNRLWQFHFGRGLVATSSDFGRLGEKPSHPELLDWLAARFVRDGWSFKSMHRLILNSATYRQSATGEAPPAALAKDPENRLLWRGITRRLDAEQIRDAILAATGELDLESGGPSVDFVKPRRTLYTRATRNTRDSLLDVFDLPEGFTSTAQRNATTTPTQALLLFNAQSFIQRAKAMAARLTKEAETDAGRVALAYRLAYGRDATPSEHAAALAFLAEQARRIDPKHAGKAGFFSEKLPYREGRAALLRPDGVQPRLAAANCKDFPTETFTVEAFVLLRSVSDDGTVRVIASQWGGRNGRDAAEPGWTFGVTSRKSASKPQTLVLQVWDGTGVREPIFSGLHLALNKPYFVAVSVDLRDTAKGGVTFHAKDLSNDDEPMQSAAVAHALKAMAKPAARFAIGGLDKVATPSWDGLIDDVRLSDAVLRPEQLSLTAEGVTDHTVGFWPFETRPSPYRDASGHGHDIQTDPSAATGPTAPSVAALIDFCHALLNSNEFLYVD